MYTNMCFADPTMFSGDTISMTCDEFGNDENILALLTEDYYVCDDRSAIKIIRRFKDEGSENQVTSRSRNEDEHHSHCIKKLVFGVFDPLDRKLPCSQDSLVLFVNISDHAGCSFCHSAEDCEPWASCNDWNDCTINDMYDEHCNCKGTLIDEDQDGNCDTQGKNCVTVSGDTMYTNMCFANPNMFSGDTISMTCDEFGDDENILALVAQDYYICDEKARIKIIRRFKDEDNENQAISRSRNEDEHHSHCTKRLVFGVFDPLDRNLPCSQDSLVLFVKISDHVGCSFCHSAEDCEPWASCNDWNDCTINDMYDEHCNCKGTLIDEDQDGNCDTQGKNCVTVSGDTMYTNMCFADPNMFSGDTISMTCDEFGNDENILALLTEDYYVCDDRSRIKIIRRFKDEGSENQVTSRSKNEDEHHSHCIKKLVFGVFDPLDRNLPCSQDSLVLFVKISNFVDCTFCEESNFSCDNVSITNTSEEIQITGFEGTIPSIKVFKHNRGWQLFNSCEGGNCFPPYNIPIESGRYKIEVSLYSDFLGGKEICKQIKDKVTVSTRLGLLENEQILNPSMPNYSIFPNPTSNEVFVDLRDYYNQSVSIMIYDQLGHSIIEQAIEKVSNPTEKIAISNLQSGLYFVRLRTAENHSITKRLVITKRQ